MRLQSPFFLIYFCLLPILASVFHFHWLTVTLALVVIILAGWILLLKRLKPKHKDHKLRLETISVSHFVEKVRWPLDRLGLDYQETSCAATLGAFFKGRTVPLLHIPTGIVVSTIGNSSHILRYLWGRYATELGDKAAFLQPTTAALALESELDGYGLAIQRWFYAHSLPHRQLTLKVWGRWDRQVPYLQRLAILVLHPILTVLMRKTFRIGPKTQARVTTEIESFLGKMETTLADGRSYLLNGHSLSFVDITFAALSGFWVRPPEYANGRAADVMPPLDLMPAAMRADLARWQEAYPKVHQFVYHLYQTQRELPASAQTKDRADAT